MQRDYLYSFLKPYRVATCTVIECHFPFPTVMKTCIGGVKVANVQFRLYHSSTSSAPVLLGAQALWLYLLIQKTDC